MPVKQDVDYMTISTWEELEEAGITLDEVKILCYRKQQSGVKNREKNAKDRAILKYAREHPELFEDSD